MERNLLPAVNEISDINVEVGSLYQRKEFETSEQVMGPIVPQLSHSEEVLFIT